jgi:hypothetical protein
MSIIYNPGSLTAGMGVLYVTHAHTANAFQFAYPAGQTVVELCPQGQVAEPGTLDVSPDTWPPIE